MGSGNPHQDMLDYGHLVYNGIVNGKMSIENDEYN